MAWTDAGSGSEVTVSNDGTICEQAEDFSHTSGCFRLIASKSAIISTTQMDDGGLSSGVIMLYT